MGVCNLIMGNNKSDNVSELYNLVWSQVQEDRADILSTYQELKVMLSGSMEKWAVCGDTLAKFADMRVKQTAQVVELLKILKKEKDSDESFTEEELEKIKNSINE